MRVRTLGGDERRYVAKASSRGKRMLVATGLAVVGLQGCDSDGAVAGEGVETGDVVGGAAGAAAKGEPPSLLGAPLVFAPTGTSFGVSAALATGDGADVVLWYRARGASRWSGPLAPERPAEALVRWTVAELEPGKEYEYALAGASDPAGASPSSESVVYAGRAVTQRAPGEEFEFVLISDTHIPPREVRANDESAVNYQEQVLMELAPQIEAEEPDFVANLGDMLDFHALGFNPPLPDPSWSRLGYLNYRRCLRDVIGRSAHFPVLGNWDGENGSFTAEEIANAREQRMLYVPTATPDTYPEGGNGGQDYYAFTWGDALFVVLNVMSYTEDRLLLDGVGSPEAWTLGDQQLAWIEQTLEDATSKWRFFLIHHTVGGAAGNDANSIYGRGGGLAANVGEQAYVHDLMVRHGVQVFFYGHDHVFTDLVVDDVHYTLPGSAGAPWKFTSSETGYDESWPDSGYARVRVAPEVVAVELVSISGDVLYQYDLE